ncbi:MAG: PASTA domain-containing protein [Treponema sp.]|nr:PASTA domain-containing protein [Treponema sp.]
MGLNFDFHAIEESLSNNVRTFILMAAGLIALVGLIAAAVFFINVRGAEQTMVPNVQGKELTAALLELQVKELYPRIQLRYTQTSADRGLILEQSPPPGALVRAGRRVQLVVSQGAQLGTIENFIDRNLDDLRMDIQMGLVSGRGAAAADGYVSAPPLLSIREPVMFEFSPKPAGTILQQRPEPGTPITGPMTLELVVSRGLEHTIIRVPDLVGLSVADALEHIGRTGIDFEFSLKSADAEETPGTVVAQTPPGGDFVGSNTRVSITVAAPAVSSPGDEVFGLFRFTMPPNPYPLLIRLEGTLPDGEVRRLLTAQFVGGRLSVPYQLPEGSVLSLAMLNREIYREIVAR